MSRFEQAVDAIVSGDVAVLTRLLGEEPQLVHARSTRQHRATLLHYVAANGVEEERQKTPANILEITGLLLNAGAEIDATADVYGGGCTTLGLAATSVHPERAGVQEALLGMLLDCGAKLEQPAIGGNGQPIVVACLVNGRPAAAAFLASKGAELTLPGAAGLGRLAFVENCFDEHGSLQEKFTRTEVVEAFTFACLFGQREVVEFLLEKDRDLLKQSARGQTGLHWAIIGGQLETVRLLVTRGALVEVKNVYGGTAIGQALWSASHGGRAEVYEDILGLLVAAGGKMPEDV